MSLELCIFQYKGHNSLTVKDVYCPYTLELWSKARTETQKTEN